MIAVQQRRALGELDSALHKLQRLCEYPRKLGPLPGFTWGGLRLLNELGLIRRRTFDIKPHSIEHPIEVRMQNSSDPIAFDQVFVKDEFAFLRALPELPRTIIDLGANVGYASVLLLNTLPHSFVLAVEPDPDNFAQCLRNLRPYGNRAKVIKGAVWPTPENLILSRGTFGDGKEWATEVRAATSDQPGDVIGFDIPTLLSLCPTEHVDFLKIDIEGSEEKLFSVDATSWLDRARNICIELHGPACRKRFFEAVTAYDFDQLQHGEYTVCLNVRRKHVSAFAATHSALPSAVGGSLNL
jgi:FkbM family methyltransferase